MRRAIVLACSAALFAGCGNEEGAKTLAQTTSAGSSARSLQVFQLEAAPGGELKFNVKVLKATARRVQLVLHNSSTTAHNISIKGNGIDEKGPVVTGPETPSAVSATVKPGTYTFYCSVDGHEAAGMKGQLIVAAPA